MIAVQLSFSQLVDAVRQLSPKEKLKLNEVIWNDDMSIPLEQQQEVLERMKMAKANPDLLIDFEAAFED
ncbi:hypothetical protein [Chitinophaga pinensis]|uniref:Addiction module component n=1 Tax=Chitinophaga pinensis (strain ATCC 43595 / DSM 2588 / LMG 13176 / NBRC 15968 / NCIMB 11800 / UQM 2034) TaxID=485918 RepID=A0A979G791_CHIPD|nr:hypothetical protein [Chitinophaga pinensis]ACU62095.1 hypothetical protein Cpin_4657 [Chitinophaga pinensis DSM 2588]